VEIALVLVLVLGIFAAALAVVTAQDKRAAQRADSLRRARLAQLGEVDPLAADRFRTR
jgi:hypothetical protein